MLRFRSTLILFSAILALPACKDKKKSESKEQGPRTQFATAEIQTWAEVGDLSGMATAIRSDLKDIFCVHVYKLPAKSDFTEELSILCQDNKPTDAFVTIDRYAGRVGDAPRSVKLALEHEADGFSKGTFVTVYRVPIAPKWVRSGSIPYFMVETSNFEYVQGHGSVTKDLTESLGGDLQFGKWQMFYHADVQTPAGTSFFNERNTEMNSFQVEGGNPDIGIGEEHLIDTANPDFKYYNTITVTIGNEDGGSTLITIIRLAIRNNGFPDVAEKVFSDIATAQATHVHDGLMAEKAAGHFRE